MVDVVIAWYAAGSWFGHVISAITHSPVCHVGVMVDGIYINVGPPLIALLDTVPPTPVVTHTFVVDREDAARGLAYIHEMDGKPYSFSEIAADLVNTLAGTHIEASINGECVCSGTVANVLLRMGLYDGVTPDQETPASLLAMYGAGEKR